MEIRGHQFLINGKPIHLHGPCKHEDTPFRGRGWIVCQRHGYIPVSPAERRCATHESRPLC
ncbi:MAG: hypothetical protein IJ313_00270 [Clostridia bacterium]|nr:hypothetical protein [Clostridia bacterium]